MTTVVWCAVSHGALAEGYNIVCEFKGDNRTVLTLQDRPTRFWNQSLEPEIRVVTARPGETAPVEILTYSDDMIKILISIEIDTFPGQKSFQILTIDRNTGVANERFVGPWRQTDTGVRFRREVSSDDGSCTRTDRRF